MKWKKCPGPIRWENAEGNTAFTVTWTHSFKDCKLNDTIYFAWTYPYSFGESLLNTQQWIKHFSKKEDVYVHREVLTFSRENRPMEMLTLTKTNGQLEEREPLIPGLFPEAKDDPNKRPFAFKKPSIFVSSRVHPGETPASFVLDGIMKFLMSDCEQAETLLTKFCFKIVPMLNPDGVYRGYFRLDTLGQNLNRHYQSPSPKDQPTIFAVKKAIVQQH